MRTSPSENNTRDVTAARLFDQLVSGDTCQRAARPAGNRSTTGSERSPNYHHRSLRHGREQKTAGSGYTRQDVSASVEPTRASAVTHDALQPGAKSSTSTQADHGVGSSADYTLTLARQSVSFSLF